MRRALFCVSRVAATSPAGPVPFLKLGLSAALRPAPSTFSPPPALTTRIMSSKNDKPTGMATEGLPKGPEIKEHTQVVTHGQPGIQQEMETKPEITRLPTQHGHQDVLSLEEYVGVGKLKGRRVIVTGGDSGIGLSAAVMMAREGAYGVAIVYHPSEQNDAENARKMIEKEGAKCLLIPVDLAEGEPVAKRIIDEVVNAWKKVDILVNNAAIQYVIPSIEE